MNEWAQYIMGKMRETDGWIGEDAGNMHIINDREMTCMGCIGETENQSTIIA